MSSTITLFEILTIAAALVGIYFKMQTEVGKLKGRIAMLEKQELQIKNSCSPSKMKYFTYSEFDSPDLPGSGHEMEPIFLEKLDLARGYSNVPYVINSGFRTPEHNAEVGGVPGSSHLTGWAAAGRQNIMLR
jgi:hypothetical protein